MWWQNFRKKFECCFKNEERGSKKETFWRRKNGWSAEKTLFLPLLSRCLDMEQFVFLLASAYKKCLISQSIVKQEFSKYQRLRNPAYQIDSLKEQMKKKATYRGRLSSRQVFVWSPYQTRKFADFYIGWWGDWTFTARLCSTAASQNAEVSYINFASLDAAAIPPTLVLNRSATTKKDRELHPFQYMNLSSCNGRWRRVVLHMGLCAI